MNNQNKTIRIFFIFLHFILKHREFKINSIIEFFFENFQINLNKETILKYIRTLKFLGFKLNKLNSQTYLLAKVSPSANILDQNYFETIKNYMDINQNNKLIEKLSIFYEKTNEINLQKKINNTIYKIQKFINNDKRVKITTTNLLYENTSCIGEIKNIFQKENTYYIKFFDIEKKEYTIININSIFQIKQNNAKNKYIHLKFPVTLKFSKKFINNYQLKENESIIKKEEDFVYIQSFYTDKKAFLNNILRYQENCEIISPYQLRKEFEKYLSNIYQKYACPNVK